MAFHFLAQFVLCRLNRSFAAEELELLMALGELLEAFCNIAFLPLEFTLHFALASSEELLLFASFLGQFGRKLLPDLRGEALGVFGQRVLNIRQNLSPQIAGGANGVGR